MLLLPPGGRAERSRLDHGRPAAAQRAGSGRRRPPHAPLPLARRRPPARVGVLGPDRAAPRAAPQAPVRRGLAPRPQYNFANLDRVVHSAATRAQGDDLDHHARPALGDGRPVHDRRVEAEAGRVRPLRARGRVSYGDGGSVTRSSTSRTSPAGSGRRATSAATSRPPLPPHGERPRSPAIRAGSPRDTIMVGELAASGSVNRGPGSSIRPLAFLRAFACVSRSFHKVSSGRCRSFKAPRADVIGHHPYSFFARPTRHSPNRDDAAIGDGRQAAAVPRPARPEAPADLRPRREAERPLHGVRVPDRSARPFAGVSLKKQDRGSRRRPASPGRPRGCARSASSASRTAPSCRAAGSTPGASSRPADVPRHAPEAVAYLSFRQPFVVNRLSGASCAYGARSAPAAVTRSRSSASGRRLERVATVGTTRRGYWQRKLRSRGGRSDALGPGKASAASATTSGVAAVAARFLAGSRAFVRGRSYLHEHMFPTALQRLRLSLRGGVALAVEFATLGELVPEYREPELPGDDSSRSAGRLIRNELARGSPLSTAAARAPSSVAP